MDTHMLAKSKRWVEAYCLPWPFSQSSSAANQAFESGSEKNTAPITSDCSFSYEAKQRAWRSCTHGA